MKKLSMYFVLVCLLGMVSVVSAIIAYAGPCYIQTKVKSVSEMGCRGDAELVGAPAMSCYGVEYPNRGNGQIPVDCWRREKANSFGIGTSGNEKSGRMSQDSVTRACFTYTNCSISGPHVAPGLPVVDYIYYKCNTGKVWDGWDTKSSFEPTGADCVGE